MLELDECDQVLVSNPFADDCSSVSSRNNHDVLVSLTLSSASDHPLRSRSVSPARRCNTPGVQSDTVIGNEGEKRSRLTPLSDFDDGGAADETGCITEVPTDGSKPFMHRVGPNDSFARVALCYGVSIAALRRANQLWPSDPIHLRTELIIPRGDSVRVKYKPSHNSTTNASLSSAADPTPSFPSDLVAYSFIAARNMILSSLPARISLDSLSSKASASEDHELDDLHKTRVRKMPETETPFAGDGLELSILDAPHTRYVPLSSHTRNHQHMDVNHIFPVRGISPRSVSSPPTIFLERPHHTRPFVVAPVRTSQLAPEPAMELPVRRTRL